MTFSRTAQVLRRNTILAIVVAVPSVAHASDLSLVEAARIQEWVEARYEGIEVVDTLFDPSGVVFDCVPIDEQPGLRERDPVTGTISFREIEIPEDVLAEQERARPLVEGEEGGTFEGDSCPSGTVPIKQVSFDEIASFGSLDEYLSRGYEPPTVDGHQYGHSAEFVDATGGSGVFNIWNPAVGASDEFSLSQIWLTRGAGSDLQTIEAGWQDYPNRTGDTQPHFFIYSTQDGYDVLKCYDGTCDDWVQVSETDAPGRTWINFSSDGGTQYVFTIEFYRNALNGNWYLLYDGEVMGYYKSSLFDSNGLLNKAERVDFGGEVAIDLSPHSSTDMGSGRFASEGWQHAAYVRTMQYRSMLPMWTDIPVPPDWESATDSDCYDVDTFSDSGAWGTHIYFGGPGWRFMVCP